MERPEYAEYESAADFHLVDSTSEGVNGWVKDQDDLQRLLDVHSRNTLSQFISCSFLYERHIQYVDSARTGKWHIRKVDHSKQLDGLSCGVYVLKFAEQYLKGGSLILGWNRSSILRERLRIGRRLLAECNRVPVATDVHDDDNMKGAHDDDDDDDMKDALDDDDMKDAHDDDDMKDALNDDDMKDAHDDDDMIHDHDNDGMKDAHVDDDKKDAHDDDDVKDALDDDVKDALDDDMKDALDDDDMKDAHDDDDDMKSRNNVEDDRSSKKGKVLDDFSYNLRQRKMKRKRSSFIYPSIKKSKRLYCKCQKPYDKMRFMVYCNQCLQWFHLDCIGLQMQDIPGKKEKFFCPDCQTTALKDQDSPNQSISQSKTSVTEGKSVSQDSEKTTDPILMKLATHFQHTKKILHIEEEDHQRHHEFIRNPIEVYNRERLVHCFGSAKFSAKVCEFLCMALHDKLVYLRTDPNRIYTGKRTFMIRNLPLDSCLQRTFLASSVGADQYVLYVLFKEMMIAIQCDLSGQPYSMVDQNFKSTETSVKKKSSKI